MTHTYIPRPTLPAALLKPLQSGKNLPFHKSFPQCVNHKERLHRLFVGTVFPGTPLAFILQNCRVCGVLYPRIKKWI